MRTFTEDEMVQVIINWEKALNPELFESTKHMDPLDFVDSAHSQAESLGLKEKFESELGKNGYNA